MIPEKFRPKLLSELHHVHPGIVKMKWIARSYFWWPGLDSSIEKLAKSCLECQAVKKTPQTAPLHPWSWPTTVFQRIHVDFAGPFQETMFLVAIDAFSKWPEVFVLKRTTVDKTVECLRSMFCRYGYPEQLVSDNGPQFVSEEFAVFMKLCGVKHIRSAPYHPATNGLAERFVQSMKQSLKASRSSGLPLTQRLSDFLLMYRSSAHSTTGVTPNSLFLKREVRTRLDLLRPSTQTRVCKKQLQQKSDHDQHARARQFSVGDPVMMKNFSSGPDWMPGTVVSRLGPLSYLVETLDNQLSRRHIDHLKSRVIESDISATAVPQSIENDPPDQEDTGYDIASPATSDQTQPAGAEENVDNLPCDSTQEQGRVESESVVSPVPRFSSRTLHTEPQIKQYPQRQRRVPPDYFRPGT